MPARELQTLPAALSSPALATLSLLAAALAVLVVYEHVHFAELRARLRRQLGDQAPGMTTPAS